MNCLHCQGRMDRRTAPFQIDKSGIHLVIDRVPAWVCDQCGEPSFEETEVERIQELVRNVDESARRFALSA